MICKLFLRTNTSRYNSGIYQCNKINKKKTYIIHYVLILFFINNYYNTIFVLGMERNATVSQNSDRLKC